MINNRDRSWVKLADVNQVIISNRILNHLQSRMVYFLMNLHLKKRNIYICRHGESEFNVQGRIGGDPELSSQGKKVNSKLWNKYGNLLFALLHYVVQYKVG